MNRLWIFISALVLVVCLSGCGTAKHVPSGSYLLDKVSVVFDDGVKGETKNLNDGAGSGENGSIKAKDFMPYVRQQPNHSILGGWKMQLGVYNLSGRDSTKWINRTLRKMGEAPVVYSQGLTETSVRQLRQALVNKGYLSAKVETDTFINGKKRKARVKYRLIPGKPHVIGSVDYEFPNDTLREILIADTAHYMLSPGDRLDRTQLDAVREHMQSRMRNRGYYGFDKQFITFTADTTAGSYIADLTVKVNPSESGKQDYAALFTHDPYIIRSITYVADYDPMRDDNLRRISAIDTVEYRGMRILYNGSRYLRPGVLYDNCYLQIGKPYSQRRVSETYQALSRMGILKFINVRFVPVENAGDVEGMPHLLDAYILLTPDRTQSVTAELEGTNSEGDLGVAVGVGYTHRNLFRGSETLNVKLRGAYEALTGNLEGFIHNRYMEYSLDGGISFPKFMFPFLKDSFKRRIRASTEFNVGFNYQERPEYTRVIATAGWAYKWTERRNRNRHTFTPVDINYVYLPASTNDFLDEIAPDNPLLRYSYEDHFIMRLGYSFYHTNKRADTPWNRYMQCNIYTVRVNVETAGNLLFALSNLFSKRHNFREDPYKIFGIRYSQYVKGEFDYVFLHKFDQRNSVAVHGRLGVAYPYGNSNILPFEKRFYGGGANGVRGWAVRTLGPGSFRSTNSQSSFMNQCGDIDLVMSVEYRAKLFWVFEGALFIDGGNIWTIHNYENQPGGFFRFKNFYKEIALAYGVGIRLDFNYFLLRFDMGMKAHNPAMGEEPWPLIHPKWKRDSSFHFSIGYPF